MEVHHHAHTERKKLKHYGFEFFMLFLAVFCGSLAEYFLEHRIERHREHEFIESMVMDLKEDTAKISAAYRFNTAQAKSLDTLVGILYNHRSHPDSIQKAYRLYFSYALNYNSVVFTDRTISQLKNSGGLRLIRNQNVSDSIMNYDAGVRLCETQFDVVKDAWRTESDASFAVFDLKALHSLRTLTDTLPGKLLTTNGQDLSLFSSRLLVFSRIVAGYARNIAYQKERGTRLITFLRKEYRIKEEN